MIIIAILFVSSSIFIGVFLDHDKEIQDDNSINILENNSLGTVEIDGPYGNVHSLNKIAIIIGVHPLENNSHRAVANILKNKNKSLNNCYYIYRINVTKDLNDFDKSRLNGQELAKNVVPDINIKNYDLVVDFHAHRGVYEDYNFIIAPLNDKKSKSIGLAIIQNISEIGILKFVPATDGHPSSPDDVTIPIINNGTSALIYETYLNESTNKTVSLVNKFITNLDGLNNLGNFCF
ncbi:hypothetical protein [Methanobrevibacter filiformis]|uniref:hypothetical protein n=1 Tax=Methanobrevibacter filiformis TaxID=55758 RepID=UPI00082B2E6D|nr:hypothetical protein [Methanobrevibacter filiformis]